MGLTEGQYLCFIQAGFHANRRPHSLSGNLAVAPLFPNSLGQLECVIRNYRRSPDPALINRAQGPSEDRSLVRAQ